MNKKYSKGKKLKKEENDLIKINEIEYLEQLLNLTGIRLEYYRVRMKNIIKIVSIIIYSNLNIFIIIYLFIFKCHIKFFYYS